MLAYIITGDSVFITEAIRAYIEKRFEGFERFMDKKTAHEIAITAARTTGNDRGDAYRIEVRMQLHSRDFFVSAENDDLHTAIDEAKEELWQEVTRSNGRRRTLFHRGARKIKELARGVYRMGKK
jgi:ribosomal subunit interface protein